MKKSLLSLAAVAFLLAPAMAEDKAPVAAPAVPAVSAPAPVAAPAKPAASKPAKKKGMKKKAAKMESMEKK